MSYTYVHHSGRFDRTPALLVTGFDNDRIKHGADVIAFTEVDAEKRAYPLEAHVKKAGWGFYRPGENYDECAFVWNPKKFRFVEAFGEILSDVATYSTTGHKRPPFTATYLVLKEIGTGAVTVFGTCHTPSHVQNGTRWQNNRRALQHRLGLAKMNRTMRRLLRKYKPKGGRVISFDLNLDIKQSWVRNYLKATFPGMHVLIDPKPEATHSTRVIDAVVVGGRVLKRSRVDAYVTPDSDHKVIAVELSHR